MRSYKSTHPTAAPPTLLLIPSTHSAISSTIIAPTSTENIKIYLTITVSTRVTIVYK